MEDKFKKNENCAYCNKELEAKYRNKKFCSDKCRVYFSREKKANEKVVKATIPFYGNNLIKETKDYDIGVDPVHPTSSISDIVSTPKKYLKDVASGKGINPSGLNENNKEKETPAGLSKTELFKWLKDNS